MSAPVIDTQENSQGLKLLVEMFGEESISSVAQPEAVGAEEATRIEPALIRIEESTIPTTEPAQEASEASQPTTETGENETASQSQPGPTEGEPDSTKQADPESDAHEPDGASTESEKTLSDSLKERVEELKKKLRSAKRMLDLRKSTRMVSTDKQKLKELDEEIAKLEAEIKETESKLKETKTVLNDTIASEQPVPDVSRFRVYHNDGKYFVPSTKGGWFRTNESAAKQYLLKNHGILDRKLRDGDPLKQIDDVMVSIRDQNSLFWAGSCGGKPAQLMSTNGKDILVLDSPKLIEPAKGEFPVIQSILLGLLGEEQLEYFNGWMKWGIENLIKSYQGGESRPGQFLALVGPRGGGKNLVQERVITPIFGGRVAKPTTFFNDKTNFNADLGGAEHWQLSDETPARDIDSRRAFGNHIKSVASNAEVRVEVKHTTPVVLRPFRRGTVSLNNEDENIRTLPPMDESIEDKIMIFSCSFVQLPLPSGDKIEKAIANELPAYVHYLLYEHQIRESLRDDRFGIKAYHHPRVLEALAATSPERQLLQEIDKYSDDLPYKETEEGVWAFDGLATEIQEILESTAEHKGHLARMRISSLLKHNNTCGTYLSRLARQLPSRVTSRRPDNSTVYRIYSPAGWQPKPKGISYLKAA